MTAAFPQPHHNILFAGAIQNRQLLMSRVIKAAAVIDSLKPLRIPPPRRFNAVAVQLHLPVALTMVFKIAVRAAHANRRSGR